MLSRLHCFGTLLDFLGVAKYAQGSAADRNGFEVDWLWPPLNLVNSISAKYFAVALVRTARGSWSAREDLAGHGGGAALDLLVRHFKAPLISALLISSNLLSVLLDPIFVTLKSLVVVEQGQLLADAIEGFHAGAGLDFLWEKCIQMSLLFVNSRWLLWIRSGILFSWFYRSLISTEPRSLYFLCAYQIIFLDRKPEIMQFWLAVEIYRSLIFAALGKRNHFIQAFWRILWEKWVLLGSFEGDSSAFTGR